MVQDNRQIRNKTEQGELEEEEEEEEERERKKEEEETEIYTTQLYTINTPE